jgi:zinc transporter 1/2/3
MLDSDTNLVVAQCVGLVLIFFSELIMGTLPMHSPTFRSSPLLMGWANSFVAGVFLAVGIVHLLPEAVEKMDDYYGDLTKELPIAFVMVIVGYTLILMLERVMFKGEEPEEAKDEESGVPTIEPISNQGLLAPERRPSRGGSRSASVVSAVSESAKTSNSATYMLLLALTVHGITEGLALGLQTSIHSAWPLWLAIFTHNWAEALCLGVTFAHSTVPKVRATIFMLLFSAATPLGIGLGMVLHVVLSEVSVAYFMALSCGTFLYFGATEVVVEEFAEGQTHWIKFWWFCVGITLMVCLKVFMD